MHDPRRLAALYDRPVLLLLCWVVAIGSVVVAVDLLTGTRSIRNLAQFAPMAGGPMVSIIVAGRNEEHGIEAGVRSLLAMDYSPLEVSAVNDRSTDGTGEVLERVRRDDPRLTVIHVSTLPPGWLGKNHALALGAARAKGDFLLFTDADVVFDSSALGRAVRFMEEEGIDHLAAFPGLRVRGIALRTLIVTFGMLFALHTRLWKARDPRSKRHIGIGAFNLLRAAGYRRLGTHAAIALRPDDDLRLGREAKRAGLRQDIVRANTLLEIEWYASFGQMIDG
jgi:glycosyltransferase involved in cell wall biosynthesis